MVRRKLLWISCLLILSATIVVQTKASGLAKVAVEPVTISPVIYPGDTFTIEVKIRDVVGLSAWEVKLSVDPTMLKPLPPVTEGTFLSDAGPTYFKVYYSPIGDYVLVGCMLLTPVTASGDGPLMTMSFQCVGAGAGKITLDAKLLDINLNPIPHNEHDCQVSQHKVGEVTDRWEEAQRFRISAEEDQYNSLYAEAANLVSIKSPVDIYDIYVRVVFVGYAMDGSLIRLVSPTVILGRGEEAVLSADFDAVEYGEGKYYFTAHAEFAYTPEGPWYRGSKDKTLSFVVIP